MHRRFRFSKVPLAGLAIGACALAGCSAAPAGAAGGSPAVGPVRAGADAANFAPFPVPSLWAGAHGADYQMVVKAKAGTARRMFSLTAAPSLVFWLGCIGAAGSARVVSPPIRLNWTVPCGTGGYPAAVTFTPPRGAAGHRVKVEVTSPPSTRWLFRADVRVAAAVGSGGRPRRPAAAASSAQPRRNTSA